MLRMTFYHPPGPISTSGRRTLWSLALLDVMAIAWMLAAGDWFDRTSRLTSVVTLGGHHALVLWLAGAGLVALLVAAAMTGGFLWAGPVARGAIAVAGGVSAIAVGGIVSIAALVAGSVVMVAVLGRAFVR